MSDTPVPPAPSPAPAAQGDDKVVAILAYVTPLLCLVGFVIAIVMHNNKKTALGAYHMRQSLGLILLSIALFPVHIILGFIPILGWIASMGLSVGVLVLLIVGIMAAVNAQEKPLPVVGELFQKWFANMFN